jgi:truncated hemoglobin YjbI
MRRVLSWLLLFSVVLGSFTHDAEARRRRRRKHQKIINEKKLYERLGGSKTVSGIVDEWLRLGLADQRISSYFSAVTAKPERIGKLRRNLNDQICELSDGPCQYRGVDMKKAHAGMKLGEDQFLFFCEDLYKSLLKYNIAEREKDELMARIGELKSEIYAEPAAASQSSSL